MKLEGGDWGWGFRIEVVRVGVQSGMEEKKRLVKE